MKPYKYDFSGYATRNDIRCTDGRIIRQDAFKHMDGKTVPLVWQHNSSDPSNIIGHAVLENRDDGVYAYANFNTSPNAQNIKDLVKHSAINSLSIYANKLNQVGSDVMGGIIREMSVVLSGANPGAYIDTIAFAHGDFEDEIVDEAIIYSGENIAMYHSAEEASESMAKENAFLHADASSAEGKTVGDILATLTDKQLAAVGYLLDNLDGEQASAAPQAVAHADGETVGDILETLTEEQQVAVGFLIDEMQTEDDESAEHSEMEIEYMKSNVFDPANNYEDEGVLTHADFAEITELAKKRGSFRDAFMEHMDENGLEFAHAGTYGMDNIGVLFPDAKSVTPTPEFIKRDTTWVGTVMNGVRHTPFSRIKSLAADITADEARARGYITGNEKVDEVFELLSRSTTPTTIYKKQKLDRDDVVDITDFDVILWLRAEMRLMLDEEIARAILIGDGRSNASNDKIKETNVRPIYTDAELYAHKVTLNEATPAERIDEIVKAHKYYKGSGSPTLFASPDTITELLLVKDTLGRRLYPTLTELAAALRVKDIVEVEVMTGIERAGVAPDTVIPLYGIIANLNDYTVGADKGGEVNAFDDFDINFNQYHYLIETRISGALTKPKAALVLELPEVAG